MICFWAQKLLVYHFNVIHGINWMLNNVDAITCCFVPLLAKHEQLSLCSKRCTYYKFENNMLHETYLLERRQQSNIYSIEACFQYSKTTLLQHTQCQQEKKNADTQIIPPLPIDNYKLIMENSSNVQSFQTTSSSPIESYASPRIYAIVFSLEINLIYIRNISGSLHHWVVHYSPTSFFCNLPKLFAKSPIAKKSWYCLHRSKKRCKLKNEKINDWNEI